MKRRRRRIVNALTNKRKHCNSGAHAELIWINSKSMRSTISSFAEKPFESVLRKSWGRRSRSPELKYGRI